MRSFWWINAWNDHFQELAEFDIPADEAEKKRRFDAADAFEAQLPRWLPAMDQARAGEWEFLDFLVDSDLPPPCVWPAIEVFFADPPPRRRGKKPVFDKDVQTMIRRHFREWTEKPLDITGPDGRVTRKPPLRPMEAYRTIAYQFETSWETVRDIVQRRHTYAPPPKFRLPKGHVDGGEELAKVLRKVGARTDSIPDPWGYEPHWYRKR